MAEVIKMRFLVRSRTAAEWTALNEVLLMSTGGTGAREMGVEEDTGKYKLGDGVTPWNDLPYQMDGVGAGDGILVDNTNPRKPVVASQLGNVDLAGVAAGKIIKRDPTNTKWIVADETGGGGGGGGAANIVLLPFPDTSSLGLADAGSVVFFKPVDEPELALSVPAFVFWKFDELTGLFVDGSGNGRYGVPCADFPPIRGGSPIFYTDGYSVSNGGSQGDKQWVADYSEAGAWGNKVTMMVWMRVPDSTHNLEMSGQFFKLGLNPSKGQGISVLFNNNGSGSGASYVGRYITLGQNGINWRPTGYQLPAVATDFHLCVRWDGSVASLFVNGVKVYNATLGAYNALDDSSFRIGSGELNSYGPINVGFDRFAIYKGAITDAEVATCAAQTNTGRSSGWWDGTKLRPIFSM